MGNILLAEHPLEIPLDTVIRYLGSKSQYHLIPIRTGTHLQRIGTCKNPKMLNIFFVLLRQTNNADIRINCRNAPASQIGSDHQKIFLDLQRNSTYKRILLNAHISAHMHGNLFFYQFFFELFLHRQKYIFKGCFIRKYISHLNPSKEICHRLRRKIISQIHRNHQCYRSFLLILWNLFPNRTQHHCCQ